MQQASLEIMNWLTESVVYLTRNTIGSLGTYLIAVLSWVLPQCCFALVPLLCFCSFGALSSLCVCWWVSLISSLVKSLYFCFLEKTVHYEEFPAPLLWSRSTIVIAMHSSYHCHVPASSSSCLASCACHTLLPQFLGHFGRAPPASVYQIGITCPGLFLMIAAMQIM
jgi:hypothetical protein